MRLLQQYLSHWITFLTFKSSQVEICQIQVIYFEPLQINKKSILQMKKDVDEDKIKWIAWDDNK